MCWILVGAWLPCPFCFYNYVLDHNRYRLPTGVPTYFRIIGEAVLSVLPLSQDQSAVAPASSDRLRVFRSVAAAPRTVLCRTRWPSLPARRPPQPAATPRPTAPPAAATAAAHWRWPPTCRPSNKPTRSRSGPCSDRWNRWARRYCLECAASRLSQPSAANFRVIFRLRS